jgi:hypothetical protein
MHCIYCGAVLQPGIRTCLSCGAAAPAETFNSSPYDTHADVVPYTPLMAGATSTSTPQGLPAAYSSQGAEVAQPSLKNAIDIYLHACYAGFNRNTRQ